MNLRREGFTIVELIIIIAVIGILAGIIAVAWPGYLRQTQDSERKNDLDQLATALDVYALHENSHMTTGSGCGKAGNGNGFVSAGASNIATYQTSIVACLQSIEAIASGAFADPSGCLYDSGGNCGSYGGNSVKAYMKATCTTDGTQKTYVFAYLESEPANDSEIDGLCDSGTVSGFSITEQLWGTNYGMNYYIEAK